MTPARLMHDAPRSAGDPLAALVTLGRPLVMGILNVTPDSFSDGGRFLDPAVAIAHAREMKDQGADWLDIGAESTRPYGGAKPVDTQDELERQSPPGLSTRARGSSTMYGACSATRPWLRWSPDAACR